MRSCCLAAVLILPALVYAKSPITHEDVYLAKTVGAPVPSPDGKWAVFSVAEPSYDPAAAVSDLWIVPADGSKPARRLTFTKSAESSPAWSGDSKRIAFSAKREGDDAAQVYVLNITEPVQLRRKKPRQTFPPRVTEIVKLTIQDLLGCRSTQCL